MSKNPLIAAILPKWAHNVSEKFGAIADKLAAAGAAAAKRIKVFDTKGFDGSWAVNFGVALARNAATNAAWHYEVYLSFWTKTVRIGFVPYKPVAIDYKLVGTATSIDGAAGFSSGGTTEFHVADEYHPNEANERP